MAIEEIRNFAEINSMISSGGQPTEPQIHDLFSAGFQTIINLGLLDPKYCLPDERGVVTSLGLNYIHIPVNFNSPTLENYKEFETALSGAASSKTFVHCAANYRVSCFLAIYGRRALGWTAQRAASHISSIWQPNDIWSKFLADAERDHSLAHNQK